MYIYIYIYLYMYTSPSSEACAEPCQTSKMELFPKIIDSYEPLTIFA